MSGGQRCGEWPRVRYAARPGAAAVATLQDCRSARKLRMSGTSDRPVFIVGCARSGTTLLQAMVHSHPRLAMPPENRFVMPVYRNRIAFGDLRRAENRDDVVDYITTTRGMKFRDLKVKANAVRRRAHEVPPTIGSLLGAVLELFAQRFDKPRWGDKRPNYIQDLDVVLELFPDAQIIHMIRDGRDCVASLKRMTWWTFGYPASVYKWAHAIDTGVRAREQLRPDQYHEIRYEDLVADPRRHLDKLCAFLDEDFDEAMLEHHREADAKVPRYKAWHEQVHKPVSTTAVQRWRRELDDQEIRLFEHIAGRQLEAVGYERSRGWLQRRPSADMRRAYASFLKARRRRERNKAAEAAEVARRYDQPVAAMLTSGQRQLARANGFGHLLRESSAVASSAADA
jgi:Sulfotransferase family